MGNVPRTEFKLDVVGVGPQRTGSTWLYQLLEGQPGLCFPHGVKETMFFDLYHDRGIDWYARYFFRAAPGDLRIEIAPTYFDEPAVVDRIRQHNPECRVIINLRDPVGRAHSLYQHHRKKGRVPEGFLDALESMPRILDAGRYATHVPRWLDAFGADNVCFVVLDDVKVNADAVRERLAAFLGITLKPRAEDGAPVNAMKEARFQWLARTGGRVALRLHGLRLHGLVTAAKKLGLQRLAFRTPERQSVPSRLEADRLLSVFEPDIQYVEGLLGRSLPQWRKPRVSAD